MVEKLSSRDFAVFSAAAATLVPAGSARSGSAVPVEVIRKRLPGVMADLSHDSDRSQLRQFLRLLDTRSGGLFLYGRPRAFTELEQAQRADALLRMKRHPAGLVRGGARALKTLVALLWVTTDDPAEHLAAWEAMGYPGPDGPPRKVAKTVELVAIDRDTALQCDVVVVGSGAGGGTAAGVLAGAGLDVIVLEAGGYNNESDFSHLERDAYRRMYLHKGLGTTADGGMVVLAGATLGGGTVINYTTSFPTPNRVREEWDRVAGFSEVFTGEGYADSLDAVASRLEVNSDHGQPSPRAQILEKGLRDLGWQVGEMPRNAVGCTGEACGYCTMGCRLGAKRSTLATYLQDASQAGARVITNAHARVVLTDGGRASGVLADVGGFELTVRARAVVLAAGALNTPAILLRSGLGGRAAGRYLRMHPVTAVWGRFSERVDPWTGILQTRYSDEFEDLDGSGYGFKFETAPVHPLFPAAFMGWESGDSFKRDILGLGHTSVAGILLRDRDHGRVVIRKDGSPVFRYSLSRYDLAHVREGVARGGELLASAGAEEVISSTVTPVRWRPDSGTSVEDFVARVDAVGYGSNQTGYFTFHQMGTARMGRFPADSVVGADNEVHDTSGLFVMDGSCFPTASGVNPMISIAAIAHRGSSILASNLA